MSLILEALKRSDAERRQAQAPVLPPMGDEQESVSGPIRWIAALATVIVLAGLAVAAWRLGPGSTDGDGSQPPAAAEPSPATSERRDPAPAVDLAPAAVPGTTVADPAPAADPSPPVPASEPAPASTDPLSGSTDLAAVPPDPVSGVDQDLDGGPIDADPLPTVPSEPPPAPIVADLSRPTERVPLAEARATAGDLPSLSQLPAGDRAAIGELTLNIHVFDPLPENRFVLINLRRYQEGGEPGPALRVERIVPDGVVLRYQERVFLLPAQGR